MTPPYLVLHHGEFA